MDKYISSVSGNTSKLAEMLDKLDDVKINSDKPIYRGIGVTPEVFDSLLSSYESGKSIRMRSLSFTEEENVGDVFASLKGTHKILFIDTTSGKRDMISIRGLMRKIKSKWYDDNTKEVLLTRPYQLFRPYKIERNGNTAKVYIKEIKGKY